MRHFAAAVLVLALVLAAWHAHPCAVADTGDDTLRHYLSRSDVVVDATIRSLGGAFYGEVGVANYVVELDVHAYVKGKLPDPPKDALVPGEPVRPRATIVRFELVEADRLPYLKEGARVVLFLKQLGEGNSPRHQTSDMWFGVQPQGPWLVRRLKELVP